MAHTYKRKTAAVDAQRADMAEKERKALQLRRQGKTYGQIASLMGCATSIAHRYVDMAIANIPKEEAELVRAIELDRLDRDLRRNERILEKLETRADQGDDKAIQNVALLHNSNRRIQERRAKYLGLDAPVENRLTGADGGAIAFADVTHETLLEKIAGLAKAEGEQGT